MLAKIQLFRLNRLFRFGNDIFVRVNPDTGEIRFVAKTCNSSLQRQAYKYSDINRVVVKNASAIVIHYRDDMHPADWIETSPSKITRMLDIIGSKLHSLNVEKEYA